MSYPRTLPLFDPSVQPSSWNERMEPGEYAVHYSSFDNTAGSGPFCTIFGSLPDAQEYAREYVALNPTLRCRIYDHHGLIGAPIDEIQGSKYVGDSDLTPRFRRWFGSILFFGGLILTIVDWSVDFKYGWPAMLGTRMLLPGLTLLFIEAMVVMHNRRKAAHNARGGRPA
jgi:hypothetical protein